MSDLIAYIIKTTLMVFAGTVLFLGDYSGITAILLLGAFLWVLIPK